MKHLLILIILFLSFHRSYGQLEKGNKQIGLGVQFSGRTYTMQGGGPNRTELIASFSVPVGIFVTDKCLLGFTPSYGKQFSPASNLGYQNNYYGELSPFITRFWGISEKWYFSLQAAIVLQKNFSEYGNLINPSSSNTTPGRSITYVYGLSLSPGINYLIGKRVMINFQADVLSLNYQRNTQTVAGYNYKSGSWHYGLNTSNISGILTSVRFIF